MSHYTRQLPEDRAKTNSNVLKVVECLANCHRQPISPFHVDLSNWQDFNWLDKTTGKPIKIMLCSNEFRQSESIPVKTYYHFITEYTKHPESKYDDINKEQCKSDTKGLLQPTKVDARKENHIGKEISNLQDEEESWLLPDEQNANLQILSYKGDEEELNTENAALQWLKKNAKPRNIWAQKLNISLPYFQQILSGKRKLTKDIMDKIEKLLPSGILSENKKPAFFEGKRKEYCSIK